MIPIYVTHGHHGDGLRQVRFVEDYRVAVPPKHARKGTKPWRYAGDDKALKMIPDEPCPIWLNAERGENVDNLDALRGIRRIYPDRRLGVFYRSDESIADDVAFGNSRAVQEQLDNWGQLRRETEPLTDFATIYGYQTQPDHERHLRGILAELALCRETLRKPVYLAAWTHVHESGKRWRDLAGKPLPIEDFAWETRVIWPLFDGVILFAPNGWPTTEHKEAAVKAAVERVK